MYLQWDATQHAGFTTGVPWMRVNEDYELWNASSQVQSEDSVLNFWQKAICVRKENEVLVSLRVGLKLYQY